MNRIQAAIYARFSDAKQNPCSIDQQVRKCREHADANGWQILSNHIYTDEAISGATDDRSGLRRLLEVATGPDSPFSTILVDDTSRLSRNLASSLQIAERLKFAGIRIIFVSQGIDTESEQAEILLATHGIVDSLYIRELGKKVYRGVEERALKGLHTGGRCFGYDNHAIEDPTQKDSHGRPLITCVRLVVKEEEAAIVRRIFELYANGFSLKRITKKLNAEGVKSPRPQRGRVSRSWCPSSIRTILRNDRYRGLVIWGKTKKIRAPSGKRIQRKVDPTKWKSVDVPEQRIVSEELWDRVQNRIDQVKQLYKNAGSRPGLLRAHQANSPYLFSGLVKCGVCGANMNIVTGRGQRVDAAYGCPLHVYRGVCTNSLRIRRDLLEKQLLEALQSKVLQDEVVEYTLKKFEEQLTKALDSLGGELEQMRKRKKQLEREIGEFNRALADGYSPSITKEIADRESELASISDRLLESSPDSVRSRLHDIRAFVTSHLSDLRGLLNSDVVTARTELAKHISEIKLFPSGKIYKALGTWDLIGAGRMDGAGGRI